MSRVPINVRVYFAHSVNSASVEKSFIRPSTLIGKDGRIMCTVFWVLAKSEFSDG